VSDAAVKRGVKVALQVGFVAAAVWFLVVPQVRRSPHSFHLVFDVDSMWLPTAVAAELFSLTCYAVATFQMLRPTHRPRFLRVLRIDLSAIALGHCLPDGGAAGTALAWRLLTKSGVPATEAGVSKVAQGLCSTVVLQVLILAGLLFGLPFAHLSIWSLPGAVAAACLLALCAASLAMRGRERAGALVRRTLARIPLLGARASAFWTRLSQSSVGDAARSLTSQPERVVRSGLSSAANWILDAFALWASLRTYGSAVSLEAITVCVSLTSLAAWLPITPSGLGVAEGVAIPALIAFGSPRQAAVLGVLTWRILAFWLPIPLGGVAYASLGSFGRKSPAVDA
jgi:hypothetical protein